MRYKKVVFLAIGVALIASTIIAPASAEKTEFIVRGEENLEDNYNITEEYRFGGEDYYVITTQGVTTLDSRNEDVSKNNIVETHQSTNDASQFNYNLEIIDAENVPVGEDKYDDINVAVLDTGVSEHENLNSVEWEYNSINPNSQVNDANGHGTHVAGIVAATHNSSSGVRGVAPEINIYDIKVLNNNGQGSLSDVANGVIRAAEGPDGEMGTEDDADVISMSLGSSSGLGISGAIQEVTPETVVVASAGNSGVIEYPAKFEDTISVASVSPIKEPSFFNAEGEENTVAAPGSFVKSLDNEGGFIKMSGTSMAAPHVSGAVAMYLSKYDTNSTVVKRVLEETAVDVHKPGFDEATGHGLLNVQKLMGEVPEPEINSVSPSTGATVQVGREISFDFTDFGASSNLSYSVREMNGKENFKQIDSPSFTINESTLEGVEIPNEILVNIRVETEGGSDEKTVVYEVVNETSPDLEIDKFEFVENHTPIYSEAVFRIKLTNEGSEEASFSADILKAGRDRPIKNVSANVSPSESKVIKEKILVEKEGARLYVLPERQNLEGKSASIKVSNKNRIIQLREFMIGDETPVAGSRTKVGLRLLNRGQRKVRIGGGLFVKGQQTRNRISTSLKAGQQKFLTKNIEFQEAGQKRVVLKSERLGKKRIIEVDVKSRETFNNLNISSVEVKRDGLRVGESSVVNVEVRNKGNSEKEFLADISINQKEKAQIEGFVSPGKTTLSTKINFNNSGVNVLHVSPNIKGVSGESIPVRVYPKKRGEFVVEEISFQIENEEGNMLGKDIFVNANIRNNGSHPEVFLGSMRVREKKIAEFEERMDSGESRVISSKFNIESSGIYNVFVLSENGDILGEKNIKVPNSSAVR